MSLLLLLLPLVAKAGPEHTHAAHAAYNYQHLALQDERVDLHGLSVTYELYIGQRWGFGARVSITDPLSGKREGEHMSLLTHYPLHLGAQALVGPAFRYEVAPEWHFGATIGPEFDTVFLTHDSTDKLRAITLGLGVSTSITVQLSEPWFAGLSTHAAFGFIDLAGDGLHATAAFDVGLIMGLRYPVNWDRFGK